MIPHSDCNARVREPAIAGTQETGNVMEVTVGSYLTKSQVVTKRVMDLIISVMALACCTPLIFICWIFARLGTRRSGIYSQTRIGQYGRPFTLYKLRTMAESSNESTITIANDVRVTKFGRFLRRYKIDELPQLYNVIKGDMSLVGPRPDVPGFADLLQGDERRLLVLKPGLTGPASIKFRDEEALLAGQPDPIRFNFEVIWPEKVKLNLAYLDDYRLRRDLRCIWRTAFRSRQ